MKKASHQCQKWYKKCGSLNLTLTHLLQPLCLQIVYCQLLNLCQRIPLPRLCLRQTIKKKKKVGNQTLLTLWLNINM